jgi:hypothetical protein
LLDVVLERSIRDVRRDINSLRSYSSQEQHENAESEVRDDIFALACLAYSLISGAHPIGAASAEARRWEVTPRRLEKLTNRQWSGLQAALATTMTERT